MSELFGVGTVAGRGLGAAGLLCGSLGIILLGIVSQSSRLKIVCFVSAAVGFVLAIGLVLLIFLFD
jgi:hypothetical protein